MEYPQSRGCEWEAEDGDVVAGKRKARKGLGDGVGRVCA